ncbi:MAG: hypothetical protein HY534_03450 [Chloroflexi bacterium]|nr:hypothetical protein [Chloroflexota bacterium]
MTAATLAPAASRARSRRIILGDSWAPAPVHLAGAVAWLGASAVVFQAGIGRDYGDALAHELLARRVVDSLAPGLAQLGTVWLPLPSLLLIPLVAIEPVWRSGIAGALVGLLYLQLAVAGLYRIGWLFGGAAAGWTAVLAFLVNPNVLYLFTAPMTEPAFLAFACVCAAATAHVLDGFARGEARHGSMMTASLAAAAAVLSRYEGWMLAALAAVVLFLGSLIWLRQRVAAEAITIGFSLTPAAAAGLWLLYNLLIFDDPLAFLRGEHSAAVQTRGLMAAGVIGADVLDPSRVMLNYGQSILEVLGPVPMVVGILGVFFAAWRVPKHPAFTALVVLASPLVFSPLALGLGNAVILTRAMGSEGIFNIRYGVGPSAMLAVAAAAVVAQAGVRAKPAAVAVCAALAISGAALLVDPMRPVVVAEGILQRRAAEPAYEAARWLRDQPGAGLILVDDAIEPLAQVMALEGGRPLAQFVGSFAPVHWTHALEEPRDISWIVVVAERARARTPDRVGEALLRAGQIQGHFRAFDNGQVAIFRREGP